MTTARAAEPAAPEAARSSAGETTTNVKLATSAAVTAPDQTAVAPRLRDQETSERTERAQPGKDAPTGPPPSFEESPLERQARVIFDPPEPSAEPAIDPAPEVAVDDRAAGVDTSDDADAPEIVAAEAPADPPPTPSERAEASFAETRTIAAAKEPTTVDVEL